MTRNILICIAAISGSAAYAGEAEKFFSERVKDFGTVPFGPTLVHYFKITNTTDKPVYIRGARVSCGCVSASVNANSLRPGSSTYLTATMDTKRFVGPKEVIVYVTFTQPYEEVALAVRANRNDQFSKSSETLTMGQVRRGNGGSGKIQVTMRDDPYFEILSAASGTDFVKPSYRLIRRDRSEVVYELSADLKPGLDVGTWTTDLVFVSSNRSLSAIRIPIVVQVVAPITVTPAVVQFPAVKVGDRRELNVVVKGDKPFKIVDIKGGDGLVTASADSDESKQAHVVHLIFKPSQPGEHEKTIVVVTDTGEGRVEIPVRGRAREDE